MGVDHSGSSDVLPEQDRWRVRICDAEGAGILLGARHVLTCAHVLLRSDDPSTQHTAPNINVVIDFVGLPSARSAKAWVAPGGWAPPDDIDGGDVALLELEAPQPTGSTTPLRRLPATRGRAVYTCGFPSGLEDGMWVDATLTGDCGPGRERVQMNARWTGRQVRSGFSGAPVFDETTQCVIGMVVSKFNDEAAGISHMLPVETIVRHLPKVSEWVSGAKAADPSLVGKLESKKLDNDLARKIVSWIQRYQATDNVQIIITGDPDSPGATTVRRAINLAEPGTAAELSGPARDSGPRRDHSPARLDRPRRRCHGQDSRRSVSAHCGPDRHPGGSVHGTGPPALGQPASDDHCGVGHRRLQAA